jgi:protoporphyrinogen/coproporphyrinogen III oxidase
MIELNDEQIVEIVKNEITEMMGLEKFEPDLLKIFRYRHAIPQYGIESEEKLKAIEELENDTSGINSGRKYPRRNWHGRPYKTRKNKRQP